MTKGHISLIIGTRGTGKTSLIQEILLSSPPRDGNLISGTEYRFQEYKRFFSQDKIYEKYDPSLIALATDNSTLVLDDCLYNMSWTKDEAVQKHFATAQERGIVTFISMLYPMTDKGDYIFCCPESYEPSVRRLYDRYATDIIDYEGFRVIMHHMRSDFSCLVIDRRQMKLYYHTVDHKKVTATLYPRLYMYDESP